MSQASRIGAGNHALVVQDGTCVLNLRGLDAAYSRTMGGDEYGRSYMKFGNSVCSCKTIVHLSLSLMAGFLASCSTAGDILSVSEVKPWERGTLARDDMQLVNDSMEQRVDDHIYFSREASTGGVSVQGGGCGCN